MVRCSFLIYICDGGVEKENCSDWMGNIWSHSFRCQEGTGVSNSQTRQRLSFGRFCHLQRSQVFCGKLGGAKLTLEMGCREKAHLPLSPQVCIMCFKGLELVSHLFLRCEQQSLLEIDSFGWQKMLGWCLKILPDSLPKGMKAVHQRKRGLFGLQQLMEACGERWN